MKDLFDKLDKDKIETKLANKGIQWRFIPPGALHFGGVHESMINPFPHRDLTVFTLLTNAGMHRVKINNQYWSIAKHYSLQYGYLRFRLKFIANLFKLQKHHFSIILACMCKCTICRKINYLYDDAILIKIG